MQEDLNSIFTFFNLENNFNKEDEILFKKYFQQESFKKK